MFFSLLGIFFSVILFINGSILFSNNVRRVVGRRIKKSIESLTNRPLKGLLVGTVSTSILQSSTASSILIASLVNSGVINFSNSVSLIFGMNIGTTITSHLIAFKFMNISPFILIFGLMIYFWGGKLKKYSRLIISFSLIFLSIFFISFFISKTDISFFSQIVHNLDSLFLIIISGVILTIIFQSSSFVSGLVLALSFSGLLDLQQSIGLILGAKIGTTSSVFLATIKMNIDAKRVALSHFMFNLISVLITVPFLPLFYNLAPILSKSLPMQIAGLQLIITVLCAFVFLLFIKPFTNLLFLIIKKQRTWL